MKNNSCWVCLIFNNFIKEAQRIIKFSEYEITTAEFTFLNKNTKKKNFLCFNWTFSIVLHFFVLLKILNINYVIFYIGTNLVGGNGKCFIAKRMKNK